MKNKNKQTKFPVVSFICCLFPKELQRELIVFFFLLMLGFTYPACYLFLDTPQLGPTLGTTLQPLRFTLCYTLRNVWKHFTFHGWTFEQITETTQLAGSDKEDHAKRRRGGQSSPSYACSDMYVPSCVYLFPFFHFPFLIFLCF